MKRDTVEQVKGQVVGFLVGGDAFEEPFHPWGAVDVGWPATYAVELANFRSKDFDGGIVLVHLEGVGDEVFDVVADQKLCSGIGVGEPVGFIADGPEQDGMYGNPGIFATEGAFWVAHEVDPVAGQPGAIIEGSGFVILVDGIGKSSLDHALGAGGVEQIAEVVELVVGEDMILSPTAAWEAQEVDTGAVQAVDDRGTVVHESGEVGFYRTGACRRKDVDTVKIGAYGQALAQVEQGALLATNREGKLVVVAGGDACDAQDGKDK